MSQTKAQLLEGNSSQSLSLSSAAVAVGSAGSPSVTFTGDLNTGIYSPGTDQVAISTGGTGRLFVDSSGRVLVGTSTTPTSGEGQYARAVVQGNSTGSGAGYFAIQRTSAPSASGDAISSLSFNDNSGNTYGAIYCHADATPGTNDYPGRVSFFTTPDGSSSLTERMRIANDGSFGLFSSSIYGCLYSSVSSGAGTTVPTFIGRHSSTGTGNGTESFKVWSNGNVVNTNNSYGAISDVKLKENIVDAGSQWNDLKALQVRKYNLKEGQSHTQIGLIAQEVELVSPGLVTESPDRDAEGNDLGTVTKSVNYSVLYMKAVKALQEAMERIEQLEISNADLLARVIALETV